MASKKKPAKRKARKPRTAAATTARTRATQLERARRLSIVEDLLVLKVSAKAIDTKLAGEWAVSAQMIRQLRREVRETWKAESVGSDREGRRIELTKMAEAIYHKAMTKRFKRYENGALTTDVPAPNLFAACQAVETIAKLHGMYDINLNVGPNRNVVELLKLGHAFRLKQDGVDVSSLGAVLDVGQRHVAPQLPAGRKVTLNTPDGDVEVYVPDPHAADAAE